MLKLINFKRFFALTCLIGVVLFCLYEVFIYNILKNTVNDYCKAKVMEISNKKSQKVFSAVDTKYTDYVTIEKNENGDISAIMVNSNVINGLKNEVSNAISESFGALSFYDVFIPIGNFSGIKWLSGLGPSIKVKVGLTAQVETDFQSRFVSTGINQSLHSLVITAKIQGYTLLSLQRQSFTTENDFIAAETVIIGKVPNSITQVYDTESDGVDDDIINYIEK